MVLVEIPPLLAGKNPHRNSILRPSSLRTSFSIVVGLYPLPFIGGIGVIGMPISNSVSRRSPKLSVPSSTRVCDLNEPQRHQFKKRRPDRMSIDAKTLEVVVGHRKPPVILTGVVSKFDFEASECTMSTQAQYPICGRFQHLDSSGCKLPPDRTFTIPPSP